MALVLLSAACEKQAEEVRDPVGLLPADSEVSGWERDGVIDSAQTGPELSSLIGTVAQVYIDNGFAKFVRQDYCGTIAAESVQLELRIADMADSVNAQAVFSAFADSGRKEWSGEHPGRAARVLLDSAGYEADFWLEQFYVWLRIENTTTLAQEIGRRFAFRVAHKADTASPEPPEPKDVVELMPLDNEISGWARSAAMKMAENETQLWDLIDGEGQVFIDNGFVRCAFQDFRGDVAGNQVDLELRIFDIGDTSNASAVYRLVAGGTETPWTGNHAGTEARIDATLFGYELDFYEDRFYCWVSILDNSDPGLAIAKLFALNVSAGIRE